MIFNTKFYKREFERLLKTKKRKKFYIKNSTSLFKIKKFIKKGVDSFELAGFIKKSSQNAKDYWTIVICYYSMLYLAKALILTKDYETDDHYSTQIALGHLFLEDKLNQQDIEVLNKAYQTFEQEYIDYFHDARKESKISRYSTTTIYSQRRVEEIYHNSKKFIAKLLVLLEKWQ
ncbi:MAG: HEPN domain-containing protein [Candidatus Nanoarchaeia archaeon]|nr:HEPN domain-containing protein [Candidatus Nanoarchaeia archaeon]MDD5740391.1 HEPN domain-containing protein [Candidatus Nanoarchaeia archaeon]